MANSSSTAMAAVNSHPQSNPDASLRLLSTKEVARLTGFSASYFEKGRIYGYGPRFIRLKSNGKTGKVLYRREAVMEWLAVHDSEPGVQTHDR